jgi:hypothetical protein
VKMDARFLAILVSGISSRNARKLVGSYHALRTYYRD